MTVTVTVQYPRHQILLVMISNEVTAEMVDNVQEECQTRLVEAKDEQKQKAAKADDAEVPVHLWNDVIKEGATLRKDRCDCDGCVDHAVSVLRELGLKRFWKRLYDDCIQRLRENYGREWFYFYLPRMKGGTPTSVGIEVQALSNIMWHSTLNAIGLNTSLGVPSTTFVSRSRYFIKAALPRTAYLCSSKRTDPGPGQCVVNLLSMMIKLEKYYVPRWGR